MNLAGKAFALGRQFLHSLDPETAHRLTIRSLPFLPVAPKISDHCLRLKLWGLDFPNPLGLAAGFDKNAEVPDAMLTLGFGHVEVGSVTPLPQEGSPKPRLFRLAEDKAVINRMGFNNEGHDVIRRRLEARAARGGIVAVNLGANKDSPDRIADYVKGLETFAGLASFITINVSSPNTPGLRALQTGEELKTLLAQVMEARSRLRHVPVVLKLAPDLELEELEVIASLCLANHVDAIAMSNTTLSRPRLLSRHASEKGGLSGRPLFGLSTKKLAALYLITSGKIPLIGIGGISDAETAWTKITAGASLLQLYSALVFKGPDLIAEILQGLARQCRERGFTNLQEASGLEAKTIAHQGLSGT
jgi:dihydroorotate dehydrogenase